LCSSGKTSSRSGQAEHSPDKRVIRPETSSVVSLTMPGQGCPRPLAGSARIWLQRQYYSERCGAIHPRGATYLGRTQESPGGCRGPTVRELYLPKARVPPGASRSDFPTVGRNACSPEVASATSTTAATVEPASMRRCAEATTPGVGDATIVRRIGAPRPNHLVRKPSVGPYDGRRSRPGSEPRLLSPSTRGKRGRNCGLQTTGWPASWVERTMTISSSTTSPYSSPMPLEPG
jgi:hypothetical protein